MALFKILRGNSEDLKNPEKAPLRDGFAYFTPDDGNFYIDAEIDGSIKRIQLNALKA